MAAANGYRDYFKILGLERNATEADIKKAFRTLARKYHPDVNPGNDKAESRFKEISEAYEVLSDSEKRQKYEQYGQYWNHLGGMGSRSSAGSGFDVNIGNYGDFDDFINDLLGRFAGSRGGQNYSGGLENFTDVSQSAQTLDAEIKITISFSEAFHGSERTLAVNSERVKVKIPRGIRSGSRLRVKGKGNIQTGTGRRGDLYLNVEVQSHLIWRLEGDQLRGELPVTFDEIALGARIKVITPDGDAFVNVPAGTLPGQNLRLKGKGWPLKKGRGDLIFNLKIHLPSQWSTEEIDLIEKLRTFRNVDPRKDWITSAQL